MLTGSLDNFYNRLGLSINASQEEIKKAYFTVAKKFHPDYNDKAEAQELFILIQEAYNTLSSPEKRSKYDQTLPKEFVHTQNILINTFFSKSSILISDKPQLIYSLISLMPNIDNDLFDDEKHIPINISLVIDVSTSMKGKRLEKVIFLVMDLLSSLSKIDKISITIFNDVAKIIKRINSPIDLNSISTKLNSINPNGGTEIYKGLLTGVNELKSFQMDSYANHLILITDGHTFGDEEMCLNLAKDSVQNNILFHCIGIGDEWNDIFLNDLAEITGGSCSYSAYIEDLYNIVFQKMQNFQKTFAKNIKLKIETLDYADIRYAFQLKPEAQEVKINNNIISINNLSINSEISLLFEILIKDTSNYKDNDLINYFNGALEYSVPSKTIKKISIPVNFQLKCSKEQELAPPSDTIINALRKLSLYRLESQARDNLEKGKIEEAQNKFNNLATQLLNAGNEDLAKTIYLQTQMLNNRNEISEKMKKNIKFGTRSLISENNIFNHK